LDKPSARLSKLPFSPPLDIVSSTVITNVALHGDSGFLLSFRSTLKPLPHNHPDGYLTDSQ
jgi:hypothetical protein